MNLRWLWSLFCFDCQKLNVCSTENFQENREKTNIQKIIKFWVFTFSDIRKTHANPCIHMYFCTLYKPSGYFLCPCESVLRTKLLYLCPLPYVCKYVRVVLQDPQKSDQKRQKDKRKWRGKKNQHGRVRLRIQPMSPKELNSWHPWIYRSYTHHKHISEVFVRVRFIFMHTALTLIRYIEKVKKKKTKPKIILERMKEKRKKSLKNEMYNICMYNIYITHIHTYVCPMSVRC